MKFRSGLKAVYQNNLHPISEPTMRNFLHMAQVHLSDPEYSQYNRSADDNDEIDDIETLGIGKLRLILNIEAQKKLPSRFIWGSMSTKTEYQDKSNQTYQGTLNRPDGITNFP